MEGTDDTVFAVGYQHRGVADLHGLDHKTTRRGDFHEAPDIEPDLAKNVVALARKVVQTGIGFSRERAVAQVGHARVDVLGSQGHGKSSRSESGRSAVTACLTLSRAAPRISGGGITLLG